MTVFFVAPVPPPVNGFSTMNQAMLEALARRTEIHMFNRAPKPSMFGILNKLQRISPALKQLAVFAQKLRGAQHRVLYLSLSGGWGQALDAAYCMTARILGAQVFIHHHSFSYINRRARLTSLVFAISDRAKHIVLCECMGEKLATAYGLDPSQLLTLSNAALTPQVKTDVAHVMDRSKDIVKIGFLSNITGDKGIYEFFDALEALSAHELPYIATIAGPVDRKIKKRFEARLATCKSVKYIGGVYGPQKGAFLASLDILLFPTKYANEAEPLTLLEALQCGVSVVAANRGCIGGLVPSMSGQVVPITEFTDAVVTEVKAISALSPERRESLRRSIIATNFQQTALAQQKLATTLDLMCKPS